MRSRDRTLLALIVLIVIWQALVWVRILFGQSAHLKLHLNHVEDPSSPLLHSPHATHHKLDPNSALEASVADALTNQDDGSSDEAAAIRLLSQYASQPHEHSYIALCSIFKNEHGNLREWVDYHRWLGVGKFYVFDHGSSPPLSIELETYVLEGLVEVFYFSGNSWQLDAPRYNSSSRAFLSPQTWAYDNCFRWFGKRHTFIGMLDADEFVVIKDAEPGKRPDLRAFLKPYEHHGGIVMQWQLMGPSGRVRRPHSETMLSYTQCIPKGALKLVREFAHVPHGFTKSFTNTKHYVDGCNPHQCALDHVKYVNENMDPVSDAVILEVHWERIAVLHYVTRSIQEFGLKMKRGSGHSQYARLSKRLNMTGRGWSYFLMVNDLSTAECTDGEKAYQSCCAAQACTCTEDVADPDKSEDVEIPGLLNV